MAKKCVGVDIGGTSVKLGIFNTEGVLLEKWEIETRKNAAGKDTILADIADTVKEHLAALSIPPDELAGIGLGVPGPVMPDGFVEICVNLGWKNKNPQKELSALMDGILVRSNNDANVAALGEMWQGGGKGYTDLVMITLGTGVGGGVIMDQKIISGRHGMAGEIGHICVRYDEPETCNCGGKGCLEQVASATGIVREAGRILKRTDIPSGLRSVDNFTAKDVLDLAKQGDELCVATMEVVGNYLGLVAADISMIVDPEIFVIGGGVSRAGDYLLDLIGKYYDKYCVISKKKAGLKLATLGNDAGIYGAARLILD